MLDQKTGITISPYYTNQIRPYTKRYVIYFNKWKRNNPYFIYDISLDEIVYESNATQIQAYIKGFILGRETIG